MVGHHQLHWVHLGLMKVSQPHAHQVSPLQPTDGRLPVLLRFYHPPKNRGEPVFLAALMCIWS